MGGAEFLERWEGRKFTHIIGEVPDTLQRR
jgi:hypothetical protein